MYRMTDEGWAAFRVELLCVVRRENALALLKDGSASAEDSWRTEAEEEMNSITDHFKYDAMIEVSRYYTRFAPEVIQLDTSWFEED